MAEVGEDAFADSMLRQAILPESLREIPLGMFSFCTSLTEVVVSSRLTSIGVVAFFHCNNLQSLTLPAGVSIHSSAFESTDIQLTDADRVQTETACKYCDGFGDVECKYCNGDGMCRSCGGMGYTSRINWNYDIVYDECYSCYWGECSFCRDDGPVAGWVWCTYCGRTGKE